MKQLLYKIGLVLLIISLEYASVEISFVCSAFLFIAFFNAKLSSKALLLVAFLAVLVLIGSFKVFNPEMDYYYFVKDLIYFTRPILVLSCTYFIVKKLKSKTAFFSTLVWMGGAYAFMHLATMVVYASNFSTSIEQIRAAFGRYNHVETVALALLICIKDLPVRKRKNTLTFIVLTSILSLSFLLYFSRTMMVVTFLIILAYYGYLKLNNKGALGLAAGLVIGSFFFAFLSVYEPAQKDGGMIDSFLYKIKNSFSESFNFEDVNVNKLDRRELWKHWRGYEASVVFDENNEDKAWVFGQGFGSTIDIGFEAKLNNEYTQYLSLTHNGFAYVYFKTGILGSIIYIMLILYLYSFYYVKNRTFLQKSYNNLIVGCSFYIIVTSFTVTGLFKPYDMAIMLVGGIFALKQLEYFEDRDTRNTGNT